MTASTRNAPRPVLATPVATRSARELVVSVAFGPLADRLVPILRSASVRPPAVVLAHASVGLLAALALREGAFVVAALLLQLKTLLDNADGRLARATGRVTLTGRYLDTEADLVVNAAVFLALASVTGAPWLALAAFSAATILLSVEFNVAALYSEVRDARRADPAPSRSRAERALALGYRVLFAPQDRLVRRFVQGRLDRIVPPEGDRERRRAATLAYHDRRTVTLLANLGLSTQLVLLGVLLVLGAPRVYLWFVPATLTLLPMLQLRRERLARRVFVR